MFLLLVDDLTQLKKLTYVENICLTNQFDFLHINMLVLVV
jgi:hypothetical protein